MSLQDVEKEVREKSAEILEKHAGPEESVVFETAETPPVETAETPPVETPETAEAPPVETAETPPVETPETAEAPPVETAETAETAEGGFDEDLVNLGRAFGVDVSRFSTEKDARAAISLTAERFAGLGADTPPLQPKEDEPASEAEAEDDVDLSSLDPAVAKALKKARDENAALREKFEKSQLDAQTAQVEKVKAEMVATVGEAVKFLDGLGSPELGVGENLTPLQQHTRKGVYELTGSILRGIISTRGVENLPTVTQILRMALSTYGIEPAEKSTSVKPSLAGKPGTVSRSVSLPPTGVKQPHDPLGLLNDPEYRRGLTQIFNR